jgi:hypothetical protein
MVRLEVAFLAEQSAPSDKLVSSGEQRFYPLGSIYEGTHIPTGIPASPIAGTKKKRRWRVFFVVTQQHLSCKTQ